MIVLVLFLCCNGVVMGFVEFVGGGCLSGIEFYVVDEN